ncbi:hypothetical protein HYDPIDRAFT_156758 [Hydnomerulius pinastri MD-312]|uniref:Unplaced genomic scaffold scaffold_18, whole genome shotgun sequence n=1 Tax=Hydnomerulius pinastri MD-312 TaxID=994086 RepID=A0A0C9VY50_9AGAM|nr:hypothetical protein HYDPIDRAFT_156758 [Hydnomerulius pinastri MD-312]
MVKAWASDLGIIATVFHSIAISSTIFRLSYRLHTSRFWWEDGWAAFALVLDTVCLACTWLEVPFSGLGPLPTIDLVTNWMVAMSFTSILWSCRISILISIVRAANPSPQLRRAAWLTGCSFALMWIALIAQRIVICVQHSCEIAQTVAISQLITDVFSDCILVALPIRLLRGTKLSRRRRILILSAFSASLLITAVTILHSAVLFQSTSTGIILIGHVKTALAIFVCNLLVIVTFIYRVCRRDRTFDVDHSEEELEFTSVDLNTGNIENNVISDGSTKQSFLTGSMWGTATASEQLTTGRFTVEEKSEASLSSARLEQ